MLVDGIMFYVSCLLKIYYFITSLWIAYELVVNIYSKLPSLNDLIEIVCKP